MTASTTATAREAFLARRRNGIGGSDAAAIVGLDPYKTIVDLYHEKTGTRPDSPATPHTERGNALEPIVWRMLVEQAATLFPGRELGRLVAQQAHDEYPWMLANVDGMTDANEVIEIKCPSLFVFRKWLRDGLPEQYILQMQHYLAVTGAGWGHYAVFCADQWALHVFPVERDDVVIEGLIEAEGRFWHEHVLPGIPPTATTRILDEAERAVIEEVKKQGGTITDVERTSPLWDALQTLGVAKEAKDETEALYDLAKSQVTDLLGGHFGTWRAGGTIVTRSQTKGRTTFDKQLVLAHALDRSKVWALIHDELCPNKPDVEVNALVDACQLDPATCEKVGRPGEQVRVTLTQTPETAP